MGHPSEGKSTARFRRLETIHFFLANFETRQDCSCRFFRRVFPHGIRVELRLGHSNRNSTVMQTTHA